MMRNPVTYRNMNTTMTERITIMEARTMNIKVKITARTTSSVVLPAAVEGKGREEWKAVGEGVLSEGEAEGEAPLLDKEHWTRVGSSSAVSPPTQWSPAILRYLHESRTP